MDEGWDARPAEEQHNELVALQLEALESVGPLSDEDALRCSSVSEITQLLRSAYLSAMFQRLRDYEAAEVDGRAKNTLLPDDPEFEYVSDCSALVLRVEAEKSRVMVFLRTHYGVRFPELAMFVSDIVLYAKVVQILKNLVDFTSVVGELDKLLPSQMLVVIISCASTTQGRDLTNQELHAVLEACQEMEHLEMAKQTFLEYIQCSMPLICPNTCAFLGTGIASQLFGIAGSIQTLSTMDSNDLIKLGSKRGNKSGVAVRTTGFLSNCDLVANLPPPLRPKALRLIAGSVLKLLRIDANRRAASKDEGVRERKRCFTKIRQWLDPPVIRGAGNVMYERRGRKRRRGDK